MTRPVGRIEAECLSGLDEVADLYAAHAVRVRRLVHLGVTAPDALVEDACQVAWMRLVIHRERVGRAGAVRWVVRVAVHEALSLLSRGARDVPLPDADGDLDPATPELLDELAERRARLARIDGLPERQRRLVWLQGLGFSYAEMSGQTGDSRRTVERQLLRAKRALTRSEAA